MLGRRGFLALALAAAAAPARAVTQGAPVPFSAKWLQARAAALARRPYRPAPLLPRAWRALTYDQHRLYWFDSRKAVWTGTDRPARIDLLHPGLYFRRAVAVHLVEDGAARPVAFDLSLFDRTDRAPDLPVDETVGYSGIRLRGELERPGIHQEYAVFQGASYFRAIGREQIYGLSAQGLAIDTAGPRGEEFPDFTAFWIEAPAPGAPDVTVHALLDGPSTSGAYTFVITSGPATVMQVSAVLYPRRDLDNAGLAPLTSMFLFDGTNRARFDDFRPQVHDSNGLLIHNGAGEVLWRPLANPRSLQVSSFVDDSPRGFGLMQRERRLAAYADFEALYHRRPALWVEPGAGWGRGAVTLVEIPADREVYDNIVAYWRPRGGLGAGAGHALHYRLTWSDTPGPAAAVAPVARTLIGGRAFGAGLIVAIDFAPHPALAGDLSDVTIHLGSNGPEPSPGLIQRDPESGGARLAFGLDPGAAPAVELRAQLRRAGRPVSEVWLYRWTA